MGGTRRHLTACLALARTVPVFSASRTWGFENYDEQAALLERHAREWIEAAATRRA
jgi:hypothetical protein